MTPLIQDIKIKSSLHRGVNLEFEELNCILFIII